MDKYEEAGREDAAWFDKLLLKTLSQTAFEILTTKFAKVRRESAAEAFEEASKEAVGVCATLRRMYSDKAAALRAGAGEDAG